MRLLRVLSWLLVVPISAISIWVGGAAVAYGPEYVKRVLVWQETDQNDYWFNFPQSELSASETPQPFQTALDPHVGSRLAASFGVDDVIALLDQTKTEAFLVIQDDRVIFEYYGTGATRETLLTSFSVAKAFVAVLVGIAIDEGAIPGTDVPITDVLPELLDRDPRFREISIRHLLRMSSGLDYRAFRWALFNGDDPLTSYHPDQRALALRSPIYARPPGEAFSYNKYHPQLLGLILERTTGVSITEFTQTRLWDPLGMEFDGSWSLDSSASGFEKMEAGLNARAIDFAKFGRVLLGGGSLGDKVVLSDDLFKEMTNADATVQGPDYYDSDWGQVVHSEGRGFYGYFVYGRLRDSKPPDIFAEGDRGQYIYASPASNLIIVRLGLEYGMNSVDWIDAFYAFAGGY